MVDRGPESEVRKPLWSNADGVFRGDRRRIPALGNAQENLSWTIALPPGTYFWSVQAVDTAFAAFP